MISFFKKSIYTILVCAVFFSFSFPVQAQTFKSAQFVTKVGDAPESEKPQAKGNFVFYCQADPKWQNSCFMDIAGCGPTSMAMIVSSFGVDMNPVKMDELFRSPTGGYARSCSAEGSREEVFIENKWLQNNGFAVQAIALNSNRTLNLEMAKKFIDSGYLILGSSTAYPCPPGGFCRGGTVNHLFTASDVDSTTNTISTRDPINCSPANPQEIEANVKINNSFPWLFAYAIKKMN